MQDNSELRCASQQNYCPGPTGARVSDSDSDNDSDSDRDSDNEDGVVDDDNAALSGHLVRDRIVQRYFKK